jgi:hypothetical protein
MGRKATLVNDLVGFVLARKEAACCQKQRKFGRTGKRIIGHDFDTETTTDRDEFKLNASVDRIVDC